MKTPQILVVLGLQLFPLSFSKTLSAGKQVETIATINELAAQVDTHEKAFRLVKAIAAQMGSSVPSTWHTSQRLTALADSEYKSATSATATIPEDRIVDAWNKYARQIQAPEQVFITVGEFHQARKNQLAAARLLWSRGDRTIWTSPNFYATSDAGTLASGCRTLEALGLIWLLDNMFQNIITARQATNLDAPFSTEQPTLTLSYVRSPNALELAEAKFSRRRSPDDLNSLREALFQTVL